VRRYELRLLVEVVDPTTVEMSVADVAGLESVVQSLANDARFAAMAQQALARP
jgi:hypothetical protein